MDLAQRARPGAPIDENVAFFNDASMPQLDLTKTTTLLNSLLRPDFEKAFDRTSRLYLLALLRHISALVGHSPQLLLCRLQWVRHPTLRRNLIATTFATLRRSAITACAPAKYRHPAQRREFLALLAALPSQLILARLL
jgi:hypothetical protein